MTDSKRRMAFDQNNKPNSTEKPNFSTFLLQKQLLAVTLLSEAISFIANQLVFIEVPMARSRGRSGLAEPLVTLQDLADLNSRHFS